MRRIDSGFYLKLPGVSIISDTDMANRSLSNVFDYKSVLRAAKENPGKFFNIRIRDKNETFNKGTKYYDLEAFIAAGKAPPTYRKIKIGYKSSETDPVLVNLINYDTEQNFEKAIGVDLTEAPLLKELLIVMNDELTAAVKRAAVNPDPTQKLVIKKPVHMFLTTHYKANHEKESLQGKLIEKPRGIFKFNWIVPKDPKKSKSFTSNRNQVYSIKNPNQLVCDENGHEFGADNYKNFWKSGEKITNLILDIESVADTQNQVSVPMIITRAIVDFDARNGYAKNEGDFPTQVEPAESTTTTTTTTLEDSVNEMMNGDFEDSDQEDGSNIEMGSGQKI